MDALVISKPVGKQSSNVPKDVSAIVKKLIEADKLPKTFPIASPFNDQILNAIISVQRHWPPVPDGIISVGGRTHTFLKAWKVKPVSPGVQLPGRLKEAWDLVNPLLPAGSYCSSGFRSAEDQRRILYAFFQTTYRLPIITKYGQKAYDDVGKDLRKNESRVLEMVRGVGQAIAAPGTSAHQQGKAVDIGGPSSIDARQVEVVTLVAKANPTLFSGKILRERNGCVHFEIR